jgi:hypothetical protein
MYDIIYGMEYLSFSPLGQWTLNKAAPQVAPIDNDAPGNKPYKAYHENTGALREDRNRKGTLHVGGGSGVKHPAGKGVRTWDKVPHLVQSAYNDRNPGVGN